MDFELRSRQANRLMLIGYLILAFATGGAFYATWQNANEVERARIERVQQLNVINLEQCEALQNLYRKQRESIAAEDLRISTLAYYKQHPDELRAAHAAKKADLLRFSSPPCPPVVTVPVK